MKRASALVTLLVAGVCAQQETISVCDALKRRISLNHKIVGVRGMQFATDEGAWLKGLDCGESLAVGEHAWPTFIWLEMSARSRRAAGFGSTNLGASVKRVNAEIAKRGFDPKRDRLWLTYVGIFETDDESGRHMEDGDTGRSQAGFGHLNTAHAQLIVKDVRDPVVEQAPITSGN
jgi:hypothetical protein